MLANNPQPHFFDPFTIVAIWFCRIKKLTEAVLRPAVFAVIDLVAEELGSTIGVTQE